MNPWEDKRMKFQITGMNLSTFLSAAALIILFGYISYKEGAEYARGAADMGVISDDGVLPVEYVSAPEGSLSPLPAISFDVPENATFAGSPLPLSLPDVRERLDKELQINCYLHSNTIFLIKRANRWLPQM